MMTATQIEALRWAGLSGLVACLICSIVGMQSGSWRPVVAVIAIVAQRGSPSALLPKRVANQESLRAGRNSSAPRPSAAGWYKTLAKARRPREFGGLKTDQVKRMKEPENARLRRGVRGKANRLLFQHVNR
jgi:hypothetical protein